MGVLPESVCASHACSTCSYQKRVSSPGARVIDGPEPPYGRWVLNPGPLEEPANALHH